MSEIPIGVRAQLTEPTADMPPDHPSRVLQVLNQFESGAAFRLEPTAWPVIIAALRRIIYPPEPALPMRLVLALNNLAAILGRDRVGNEIECIEEAISSVSELRALREGLAELARAMDTIIPSSGEVTFIANLVRITRQANAGGAAS